MPRSPATEIERQARARMRLMSPQNASKVVSRDIYWTVPFLVLYLEQCDELGSEDPASAYLLAVHAPHLARRIGVGERPGEYRSERQKTSFEVLALAVLAGMCRRAGKIGEASARYREAFEICGGSEISVEARAELVRRYALFLFLAPSQPLGRPEHGAGEPVSQYLQEAIELYESIDHRDGLAESLLSRGTWQAFREEPPFGALDFCRALQHCDRKTARGKRTFNAALANFAYVVAMNDSATLVDHAKTLELLQEVKRRLGSQRRSRTKMMVLAMEGQLYAKLHFHRQAARLMSRAREGFFALGLPEEFARFSFELAVIYLEDGEPELFESLRDDTQARFPGLSHDRKLLELVGRWHGAVRSVAQLQELGRSVSVR